SCFALAWTPLGDGSAAGHGQWPSGVYGFGFTLESSKSHAGSARNRTLGYWPLQLRSTSWRCLPGKHRAGTRNGVARGRRRLLRHKQFRRGARLQRTRLQLLPDVLRQAAARDHGTDRLSGDGRGALHGSERLRIPAASATALHAPVERGSRAGARQKPGIDHHLRRLKWQKTTAAADLQRDGVEPELRVCVCVSKRRHFKLQRTSGTVPANGAAWT